MYLHIEKLARIHETKYFGRFLSGDQCNDVEISKQIRTLYIRSNKLFQMFSYCTIAVKMDFFLEVIVHVCIVVLYGQIIGKQHIEN